MDAIRNNDGAIIDIPSHSNKLSTIAKLFVLFFIAAVVWELFGIYQTIFVSALYIAVIVLRISKEVKSKVSFFLGNIALTIMIAGVVGTMLEGIVHIGPPMLLYMLDFFKFTYWINLTFPTIIFSILGIIFGISGLDSSNRKYAKIGLILNLIALVIYLFSSSVFVYLAMLSFRHSFWL